MSSSVAVVYFSGLGLATERLDEAIAMTSDAALLPIDGAGELMAFDWAQFDNAEAIVFGSSCRSGILSAQFRAFLRKTFYARYAHQRQYGMLWAALSLEWSETSAVDEGSSRAVTPNSNQQPCPLAEVAVWDLASARVFGRRIARTVCHLRQWGHTVDLIVERDRLVLSSIAGENSCRCS